MGWNANFFRTACLYHNGFVLNKKITVRRENVKAVQQSFHGAVPSSRTKFQSEPQ